MEFETQTSQGTYIRSIAHDMGKYLGCGAHLSKLTRNKVGDFSLDQAISIDKLQIATVEHNLLDLVIPMEELLPDFPKIVINQPAEIVVLNGGLIKKEHIKKIIDYPKNVVNFRLFNEHGNLLAIARLDEQGFKPYMVFSN